MGYCFGDLQPHPEFSGGGKAVWRFTMGYCFGALHPHPEFLVGGGSQWAVSVEQAELKEILLDKSIGHICVVDVLLCLLTSQHKASHKNSGRISGKLFSYIGSFLES